MMNEFLVWRLPSVKTLLIFTLNIAENLLQTQLFKILSNSLNYKRNERNAYSRMEVSEFSGMKY